MLTDEAKIKITAGRGGDGAVAFDKVKMSLGPTGGRGGNGADIYFLGVGDIFALNKYRHQKEHFASDGKNGRGGRSDGPAGRELILTIPVGTIIHNLDTKEDLDITTAGQKILAAKGGLGGRGNFYFRSPTNTSPQEYEEGSAGEEFNFMLELRLIADVGLIGLPSAGKSSLLNELTAANAKVGDYHFTTLEPNLGVMDLPPHQLLKNNFYSEDCRELNNINSSEDLPSKSWCGGKLILADIPGLIEGASSGRGLGIKFLRHIQRTKILLHCLSLESEDVSRDYKIIRQELKNYSRGLIEKKELVLLTKSDLLTEKEIEKKIKKMKLKNEVMAVSIHDLDSLGKLKHKIIELLR